MNITDFSPKERREYWQQMDAKYQGRDLLKTIEAAEFLGKPARYIRVLVYEQEALSPAYQPTARDNLYQKEDLIALRDSIFQEEAPPA